jgi:hypothetical protein
VRVRAQLVYLAALHGVADAQGAADRWIERLGIAERAEDRVEQLSLGNQQRVQPAAALVHEPDLLSILQVANQQVSSQAPPHLQVVTTEPEDPDRDAKAGLAFFAILILYGQLLTPYSRALLSMTTRTGRSAT